MTVLAFFVPAVSCAQVMITEIMYDPPSTDSAHEWIELYNESTSSETLAHWKLYARGASHNIIAASSGAILLPGSYAVVAQNVAMFKSQYPNFSGMLYHSAITLDNAGDTLELLDASSTVVDTATYDSAEGALGDGNSLQRTSLQAGESGSIDFVPRMPTPGAAISQEEIPPKPVLNKTKSPTKPSANSKSSIPAVHASSSSKRNLAAAATPQVSVPRTAPLAQSDSYLWPIALAGICIVAGGSYAAARSYQKREWDIVEETVEDV